jgi:phosphoenolpyruvate carboxykinase (GTP)
MSELLTVDSAAVADQLPQVQEHLARFGDHLPQALSAQLEALKSRLA